MHSILGRHRSLLFRSYLVLVVGLLLVAAVLDMGFGYLQSSLGTAEDRWLTSTFTLIEERLAATSADERTQIAETMSDDLGIRIEILERDEIVSTADSPAEIDSLVDADGDRSYLKDAPTLGAMIRLGPVPADSDNLLLRMLPPLFYLSIFVVVGIWLRPILKELNLITTAAQRFAADYRQPLSTGSETTQLTELANHLDDMSGRLSGLIQSQKELIAALSHEMRTPLARIRFALAVVGNNSDDGLREQLDEMNNDVQEIDQLIATMLSYARLDHPDLRMNWQDVPLEPWLAQIEEKCRHAGKELTIERSPSLETAVMDPRLMGLALSNLLTNACRYAVRHVRCRIAGDVHGYSIAVEDDGKGIPESERQTVFKAFTRLDDSRNRETGGYGLGLAIVARITGLHGGTVDAGQSDELGGARIEIAWQPQGLPD